MRGFFYALKGSSELRVTSKNPNSSMQEVGFVSRSS
jgi:hypothetical protein